MPVRSRLLPLVAVALLAPCCLPAAIAQSYPVKPVRMIIASGPGGQTDTTARLVTAKLTQALGHVCLCNPERQISYEQILHRSPCRSDVPASDQFRTEAGGGHWRQRKLTRKGRQIRWRLYRAANLTVATIPPKAKMQRKFSA